MPRRIRVLLAKIGLDSHTIGVTVIAKALRDAGMEVIYTPPWQEIEAVVALAQQEDVDVIGISSLATDHLIVPDLMSELQRADLGHVAVIVGGIIPDNERAPLADAGVDQVFGPGTSREEIVDCVTHLGSQARETKLSAGDFSL